jgi:hypothetical protein
MMASAKKIVLHSLRGYRPELDTLIKQWIDDGVMYVGVFGVDAAQIEDRIDALCVGDGSEPHFMLTASHRLDEGLEDAIKLSDSLSDEFAGRATVIEF